MAIHELDELTPRIANVAHDVLIGETLRDPEQTAVHFDVPTKSGGVLLCSATIHHDGETVVNVILPPHFRDYAEAAGLERDDLCFEGYLETMAKLAFARTTSHLTCRLCGEARAAAPVKCGAGTQHDWIVAR